MASALVVVVGLGGWAGGRLYAGEPVLSFGGSSEAAGAEGTDDPSPGTGPGHGLLVPPPRPS